MNLTNCISIFEMKSIIGLTKDFYEIYKKDVMPSPFKIMTVNFIIFSLYNSLEDFTMNKTININDKEWVINVLTIPNAIPSHYNKDRKVEVITQCFIYNKDSDTRYTIEFLSGPCCSYNIKQENGNDDELNDVIKAIILEYERINK